MLPFFNRYKYENIPKLLALARAFEAFHSCKAMPVLSFKLVDESMIDRLLLVCIFFGLCEELTNGCNVVPSMLIEND